MNSVSSDPSIRERWARLDEQMLPLIKVRAKKIKRFTGAVSFEDVVQEGRMALLFALMGYKEEEGELERYINKVLYNKFINMGMEINEEINQVSPERLPIDYVIAEKFYSSTPEKIVSDVENLELIVDYDAELYDGLTNKERKVYRKFVIANANILKKDIPEKFKRILSFLEGQKITSKDLGVLIHSNKNGVDYLLRVIRTKALKLTSRKKYKDLFSELVESRKWLSLYNR